MNVLQRPTNTMALQIFCRFEHAEQDTRQPAAAEFYAVLQQLRDAVRNKSPEWATYQTLVEYEQICFWAIRKLEYSFAAEAFAAIEATAERPLRVLDVGSGIVPFCNWMSRRGHAVTAVDPLESDIQFLTQNDLNAFYGSNVDYRLGRAEQLEFADGEFDVVTCISVLEHIPPGNDRLSLWEMARVLKPGGRLIISFDVSPPPVARTGQRPWPADRRRYADPFSPQAAARLLGSASQGFEIGPDDLPADLKQLTWDHVHEFWRAAQAHDQRDEPLREYLAMGGLLTRHADPLAVSQEQKTAAYLEGQEALHERLEFFAAHAAERLNVLERVDQSASQLRSELEDKQRSLVEVQAAAEERQQALVLATLAAEERGRLVDALGARVAEIETTLKTQVEAISRLSLAIEEGQTAIQQARSDAHAAVDIQLRVLEREKEAAEAAAAARLTVIEEQERALKAFREARSRFPLVQRVRNYFVPRLGVLYQYPPRELEIPPNYLDAKQLSHPPLISIVTPTLNQGQFIERTLRSVLDQHYPNLEYIVQDGGSTDDTAQIMREYVDSLAHAASEKDSGLADGINRGFRVSTGEIMAYLNSDDVLLPGTLNYVAWYFSRHPDVDVVYGHRVIIDEYDGEIGRWVLPPHDNNVLSWADFVPQETMFWRRAAWERIGSAMDETFRFAVDWDLLLRLRDSGARMHRLPRFLGGFRVHPHQKTSAEMLEIGANEMSRLRERALGRRVFQAEVDRSISGYLRQHFVYHKLYRLGVLRY